MPQSVAVEQAHQQESLQRRRWQRWLLVGLRVALFALAVAVLRHQIASVDGAALWRALRSYGWPRVTLALFCTAASFLTLGVVELLALHYADGRAARKVTRSAALITAFVSHAFSQSVGFALLTGAAVRLRAYLRYGVDAAAVARASAFATVSVMLGLLSLGSVALLGGPSVWRLAHITVSGHPAGVLLATIVLAYMAWSSFGTRAALGSGRWRLPRPSPALAAGQLVLSAFDWLVTGTVLFAVLPAGLPLSYAELLRAYLLAQTVGIASHVPGGAGVFEVVLLALLAPGASATMLGGLAASLVAYRVIYYLLPLCAATTVAAIIEIRRSRLVAPSPPHERVRIRPPRPPVRSILPIFQPVSHDHTRVADAAQAGASVEHRVEWLIDNAVAYDRVLRAISTARRSIWITQLAFDADCAIYTDGADPERECSPSAPAEAILAETLFSVATSAPVDIRILLNATILLDTARPLRQFFTKRIRGHAAMTGRIRVRGVRRFPNFLHLKIVIVDGREAFLLGSPFVNSYWDTQRHPPIDARRPMRELSGRPLHDVSLRIEGPEVQQLETIFAELWNGAGRGSTADSQDDDESHLPFVGPRRDRQSKSLRVVRTLPRRVLPHAPDGVTEALDALLEGIERARSLIYIEHQYLTARPVVAAILRALRRSPDLEIVIVLNQNPDLTAYRGWQNARIVESGLLEHPRVGLFTLWSAAPCDNRPGVTALNQLFVHSKVVTVDDSWAMVGAVNLDGLSLHSYGDDFTGRLARRVFRHVRNFEVSVVVRDDLGGDPAPDSVASLRKRLWSEHLGLPDSTLALRPPRGWLRLWRARANANVTSLNVGADHADVQPLMHGFALPYSVRLTPAQQLADIGVRVDPARLDVCFDPGWLEVRFSPGWVRNMLG